MAVIPTLGKEHNHALNTTKPNTGKGVAQGTNAATQGTDVVLPHNQ